MTRHRFRLTNYRLRRDNCAADIFDTIWQMCPWIPTVGQHYILHFSITTKVGMNLAPLCGAAPTEVDLYCKHYSAVCVACYWRACAANTVALIEGNGLPKLQP